MASPGHAMACQVSASKGMNLVLEEGLLRSPFFVFIADLIAVAVHADDKRVAPY